VIPNLGQLADLLRNPEKIREQMEKSTDAIQVEGTAGGGAVTAKINGRLELLSVRIDPKLLTDGDAELLEDLVVAAVGQGQARAREELAKSIQSIAGGLPLPNFFGGK
jgi:nucleoid-associated protein EbfC